MQPKVYAQFSPVNLLEHTLCSWCLNALEYKFILKHQCLIFFADSQNLHIALKNIQAPLELIRAHISHLYPQLDIQFFSATNEAFDIEIPEINAVYTHMLGHDCHSIVAGTEHADAMISEIRSYIEKGFDLILTSHYTPEDLKDAETKIAYLENLKQIAADCRNADEFKSKVEEQYPQYSGQNYLDMTAEFFFA